jgi:hypothetical protein
VILNQKIQFVELKTPTGKLSPRQVVIFNELDKAGFPVRVVKSKEDVEELIREITTS